MRSFTREYDYHLQSARNLIGLIRLEPHQEPVRSESICWLPEDGGTLGSEQVALDYAGVEPGHAALRIDPAEHEGALDRGERVGHVGLLVWVFVFDLLDVRLSDVAHAHGMAPSP